MRSVIPALALLAVAAGPAAAQPAPPPPPAEPTPFAGPGEQPPAPPVAPATAPAPAPAPMQPPEPPPSPAADAHRPSGLSIGIGLGYDLPTSLQTPNITSVRVRLASGLTLEPRLTLAKSSVTVDTGPSTTSSASELGIGALARYPLSRRGRVDLELLGGLDVNQQNTTPEGEDQDVSITTLTASYGLAVGAWLTPHWQVSISALNPIVTSTRRDEELGPGTSTVTTNTTYGLIFEPNVLFMLHLYY